MNLMCYFFCSGRLHRIASTGSKAEYEKKKNFESVDSTNKRELMYISIIICNVCSGSSTVKMHAKRNQKQRMQFMSLISICLMNSFILTATHENNAYNGPYKVLNRIKKTHLHIINIQLFEHGWARVHCKMKMYVINNG